MLFLFAHFLYNLSISHLENLQVLFLFAHFPYMPHELAPLPMEVLFSYCGMPTNPRQCAFPQSHYRLASPRRQEGCSLMSYAHPKVLPIKGQFRLIKNYYTTTQPLPTTSSRALSTYEKLSAE